MFYTPQICLEGFINANIFIVIINFDVDLEDKYERYRLHFFPPLYKYFCPTINASLPKLPQYTDN